MRELFVSYEVALKLKAKGFDEDCICGFNSSKRLVSKISHSAGQDCKCEWNDQYDTELRAPLYQQVIDWLWATHNIFIDMSSSNCDPTCFKKGFEKTWLLSYRIKTLTDGKFYGKLMVDGFGSDPKEMLEDALQKALELI